MSTTPQPTHVCFVHASCNGTTWSIQAEKKIKFEEMGTLADLKDLLGSVFPSTGASFYNALDIDTVGLEHFKKSAQVEAQQTLRHFQHLDKIPTLDEPELETLKAATTAEAVLAVLNQAHVLYQLIPNDKHIQIWTAAIYADLVRVRKLTHIYVLKGHPDLPTPWGLLFCGEALTSTVGPDGVYNWAIPSFFKKGFSQCHAESVGTHQLQCAKTKQSVGNWLSNSEEVEYDSAGDADSDAE